MPDDIPDIDPGFSEIWRLDPARVWDGGNSKRIWSFVVAACPMIEPRLKERGIHNVEVSEIAEIAVRATRASLAPDIVGSLWFLAATAGNIAAMAVLIGLLERPSDGSTPSAQRRRAIRYWRRRLARVDALPEAKQLSAEFSALAEAATSDAELSADRKRPEAERRFMILAPTLASEIDQDREIKNFADLAKPLPLWRSNLSTDVLRATLALEFPHLEAAIEPVVRAVLTAGGDREPPVLLVGGSGIGKDSLWRRAAELAGRPFAEYELAGTADSRTLKGTSKGYSSRNPSYPANIARQLAIANPLILLTELEKAGGSRWNGIVFDTLLAWIEPGSRDRWFDDGLGVELNLSRFTFGFSANRVEPLSGPLRSRLRIIQIGPIQPTHLDPLLEGARRRRAIELGIRPSDLPPFDRRAIARLRGLARRRSLNLRMLERVMRVAYPDGAPSAHVTFQ